MASDAIPAVTVQIGEAVSAATGIPVDDLHNVVIAYETADESGGTLMMACCQRCGVRLLAWGIQQIMEQPVPDIHIPGHG